MRTNSYPSALFALLLFFCLTNPSFAQLEFKIELMGDTAWGIYVQPDQTITPSQNTVTGSGQATVVVPTGFQLGKITNYGGRWISNARVNSPIENPTKDYVSFGLSLDNPPVRLTSGEETLLFMVEKMGDCPDTMHLIDINDPFLIFPNSVNNNPGNDLSMFDIGTAQVYNWTKNYQDCAWSCRYPCDETEVTTGSKSFDKEQEISIFPNPSRGIVNIDHSNTISLIEVFNTTGQKIYSKRFFAAQETMSIDLSAYSDGFYMMTLNSNEAVIKREKIILKK